MIYIGYFKVSYTLWSINFDKTNCPKSRSRILKSFLYIGIFLLWKTTRTNLVVSCRVKVSHINVDQTNCPKSRSGIFKSFFVRRDFSLFTARKSVELSAQSSNEMKWSPFYHGIEDDIIKRIKLMIYHSFKASKG